MAIVSGNHDSITAYKTINTRQERHTNMKVGPNSTNQSEILIMCVSYVTLEIMHANNINYNTA